jgi:hypothetical protein
MQPWEEPARQLPVTFPPVGGETVGSYLNRLALANRMRTGALARYLAPYRRAPNAIDDDTSAWTPTTPSRLAVIGGQPLDRLTRALPALGPPALPPRPHHRLAACRRCMASRGVTCLVVIRDQAHRHLCVRHGLWLRTTTQVEVTRAPEVACAQRRHARLARRGDPDRVATAHAAAHVIVLDWYGGRWHRDLTDRWQARLHALGVDPRSPTLLPWADYLDAAVYPEAVALTSLLASPTWRAHVATAEFYKEAGRRLGIAYPRTSASDPLARWAWRTLHDPDSENGQND